MQRRTICALILISAMFVFATANIFGPAIFVHAAQRSKTAPAPFLYRPYYGTQTVLERSLSGFDHDHPDYSTDNKFVRYDGQTTLGPSAVTGCVPGKTCYDGHNGYDINMFFEPVLAAGSGTVIRAGWFNSMNHLDGGGLWVAIDHGNGYTTMYCHLSAVLVSIGQTVQAQWQIGTSGTTGSATGPHLHFSAFQMPNWLPMDPFGWQSTKLADPNTVPDYYLWVGNPVAPNQAPCLGCDYGAPHAGATVVDDTTPGFSVTGTWQMDTGAHLINGTMHWVGTTTGTASATATWQPTLPTSGLYEVGVYVDPQDSASQWVPYTITSLNAAGQPITTTVRIDQYHIGTFKGLFGTINTGPQWVSLGTYNFGAGASVNGQVMLSNATGENNVQLGADAAEFVPVMGSLSMPAATPTAIPTLPPTPTPPIIIPPHNRWHP